MIACPSADADEFDPLVVYEEARALNDQWQACAASVLKGKLRSDESAERLAKQALDQCRTRQDRLGRFLNNRIGETSARNVVAFLREKYQSGLVAAITEMRTRD